MLSRLQLQSVKCFGASLKTFWTLFWMCFEKTKCKSCCCCWKKSSKSSSGLDCCCWYSTWILPDAAASLAHFRFYNQRNSRLKIKHLDANIVSVGTVQWKLSFAFLRNGISIQSSLPLWLTHKDQISLWVCCFLIFKSLDYLSSPQHNACSVSVCLIIRIKKKMSASGTYAQR